MFEQIFESFKNCRVAVVGDTMLDTYWWGKTERISPEAPVPIVALQKNEYRLGGAANVALNLVSLGAQVAMFSVTGADDDGQRLSEMLQQHGIDTSGVLAVENRITTNKIRIISRSQHLLRIDKEISADIDEDTETDFLAQTLEMLSDWKPQVLIFEDYNKGLLTAEVIRSIGTYCKQAGILTAVDPKRNNFFAYKWVDIFKPNLKEVREALNLRNQPTGIDSLKQIHAALQERLNHRMSLITLSELGVFIQEGAEAEILPAHIRNIADVSGAGDTVIAVASLVYATTRNRQLMAAMANLAGGIVCEEVGTAAINAHKLMEECKLLLSYKL